MSFTVVYKVVFVVKLNFMYLLTWAFGYHSIHRLPKNRKILKGHEKCDKDLNIAEKPEEQFLRFIFLGHYIKYSYIIYNYKNNVTQLFSLYSKLF